MLKKVLDVFCQLLCSTSLNADLFCFIGISFQSSVEDVINFIEGHPNKDGIAMEILKRYMSITWNGKVYCLFHLIFTFFSNL